MKKFILLCGILLIVSCKSKSPAVDKTIEVLKVDEVEAVKKDRAYELGKRVLEACNTSRFKAFSSSEATDKVRQNATKEKISSTCKKINQRYGRYKGLTLLEVTHNKVTNEYVFRYSIDYEKKYFKKELKVTINSENKVSAIATQEIPTKPM
jgi:5'-3' exonuclease